MPRNHVLVGASHTVDDLSRWLRGDLLEIILLISGAFLFIRGARWLLLEAPRSAESGELSADDAEPPSPGRNPAIAQALGWVVTAFVSVVIGVLVADRFGLPLATLVPTATVVGVAVGFGAQRIILDLLSGFFLLTERQLSIGDVVTVSAPGTIDGVSGTVEEITLRATRLRTLQGDVVFISNGEIRQLTNMSVDWARLVIDVPIRPGDDVDRAIEVLGEVCEEIRADEGFAGTFLEGPDVWGVQTLGVGVIQVRLSARVPAHQQWAVARELRRRAAHGLVKAGVEPVTSVVVAGSNE